LPCIGSFLQKLDYANAPIKAANGDYVYFGGDNPFAFNVPFTLEKALKITNVFDVHPQEVSLQP
jgi:hypothetical protein